MFSLLNNTCSLKCVNYITFSFFSWWKAHTRKRFDLLSFNPPSPIKWESCLNWKSWATFRMFCWKSHFLTVHHFQTVHHFPSVWVAWFEGISPCDPRILRALWASWTTCAPPCTPWARGPTRPCCRSCASRSTHTNTSTAGTRASSSTTTPARSVWSDQPFPSSCFPQKRFFCPYCRCSRGWFTRHRDSRVYWRTWLKLYALSLCSVTLVTL